MSDRADSPASRVPTGDDVADVVAERDRLRAEIDDLRGQLVVGKARRSGRVRRISTSVLVVVTSLVVTVAVTGVWARGYLLNTDRWVREVGPVVEDPAVQAALGVWITDELMTVIDPQDFFEEVLPERGQILAAPLSNAVQGFVNDQVDTFIASDAFQRLWVEVNRRAHARAVDVLEGDLGDNLQVEGDEVVLNLVPVLNRVLAEIGDASPEILGREVDLPTVTVDELPEDAIDKVATALGRDVPDDFGQFTVFRADRLQEAQDAVSLFDRFVVLAVIAAVLLIAASLWLAPRRRRTLLQLMVGIGLGVVVVRRLGLRMGDDIVDFVRPENRDAASVVVDAFISTLMDLTAWVLVIAVVIALVAALSGPYPWARAVRGRSATVARGVWTTATTAAARRPDEPVVAWMADHREALQLGGVLVGIVVLLVADLSWGGLLLLALLVGALELVVSRLGDRGADAGEPVAPDTTADVP
jgi:hypothetical protein